MSNQPTNRQGVRDLNAPRNGRVRHTCRFIPENRIEFDMGECVYVSVLVCIQCGRTRDPRDGALP